MKKNILFHISLLYFNCHLIFAQNYPVGQVYTTWNDPARSRDVTCYIYYPAVAAGQNQTVTTGSFPVIVFGHGFVMTHDAYAYIKNLLVPKGYIVVMPTTESGVSPNHASFGADMAFLINKMQSEGVTNASPFYNHVEPKSAVMGHSMGGGSAFLAAENNSAVTTMVTLAAAETNPSSTTAAGNINIPSLSIAGAADCVAPPATNALQMHTALASSCKTYISVNQGSHCYFGDYSFNCTAGESLCNPVPALGRALQQDVTIDMACLWFDHWLKGSCQAWEDLQDSLAVSPRITSQQSCSEPTPSVSFNGLYLEANPPGTYYQWYYEGTLIPGANGQLHDPEQPGNYSVGVNYNTNCPVMSASYPHNVTGVAVNDPASFSVYPNPARDVLFIQGSGGEGRVAGDFRIYNSNGELVYSTALASRPSSLVPYTINISSLSPGIYFINFTGLNGNVHSQKMIKR